MPRSIDDGRVRRNRRSNHVERQGRSPGHDPVLRIGVLELRFGAHEARLAIPRPLPHERQAARTRVSARPALVRLDLPIPRRQLAAQVGDRAAAASRIGQRAAEGHQVREAPGFRLLDVAKRHARAQDPRLASQRQRDERLVDGPLVVQERDLQLLAGDLAPQRLQPGVRLSHRGVGGLGITHRLVNLAEEEIALRGQRGRFSTLGSADGALRRFASDGQAAGPHGEAGEHHLAQRGLARRPLLAEIGERRPAQPLRGRVVTLLEQHERPVEVGDRQPVPVPLLAEDRSRLGESLQRATRLARARGCGADVHEGLPHLVPHVQRLERAARGGREVLPLAIEIQLEVDLRLVEVAGALHHTDSRPARNTHGWRDTARSPARFSPRR